MHPSSTHFTTAYSWTSLRQSLSLGQRGPAWQALKEGREETQNFPPFCPSPPPIPFDAYHAVTVLDWWLFCEGKCAKSMTPVIWRKCNTFLWYMRYWSAPFRQDGLVLPSPFSFAILWKEKKSSRGRLGEAVVIRGYTVFKSIPTLFLLILAYIKLHKNNLFCKILKNKWHCAKFLPKRFHLNGNTIGFHPQTQKLELHTKQEAVGAYIWASMTYECVKFLMCIREVWVVQKRWLRCVKWKERSYIGHGFGKIMAVEVSFEW